MFLLSQLQKYDRYIALSMQVDGNYRRLVKTNCSTCVPWESERIPCSGSGIREGALLQNLVRVAYLLVEATTIHV